MNLGLIVIAVVLAGLAVPLLQMVSVHLRSALGLVAVPHAALSYFFLPWLFTLTRYRNT